jgi:YVTN family beta-propeller protein
VAVSPDGSKVYVANAGSNNVSVIATVTDTVIDTVNVGEGPQGIAVSPDGSKVYVVNDVSDTVSVIATATNTVTGAPITVGSFPIAFGQFIGPAAAPPPGGPVQIPTLSGWALLVLAISMALLGAKWLAPARS